MKASEKPAGSWVITCMVTGYSWEVFSRDDARKAESVALVETAQEYLARINEEAKEL
ncbi:hypothetical protein DFO67_10433 [Modicisalibacter xianhensis]|uniref:Uncharacterized protein n=1 Tax=Modicisalibacter xianhensis TaxID=442341 RepID=A0A4R8FVD4_9GAMM|nr:hypothetical protein [Halomonas xianhensis]TDX30778.1 hypothetical protein DFO67_10433 [Halomonas xianhensis]